MYNLSLELIKENAALPSTYQRGRSYYLQNRVKDVSIIQGGSWINSTVTGTVPYKVTAVFTKEGNLKEMLCSCPAANRYYGLCKHMIAMLLYLLEQNNKGNLQSSVNRQMAKKLFEEFAITEPRTRRQLILEATYESDFAKGYRTNAGKLRLRLGEERLYIVKSIPDLIRSIKRGSELYFGKNFSYDPRYHVFSEQDRKLITFLEELLELGRNYSERELSLGTAWSKRFFQVMADNPFIVEIQGVPHRVKQVVDNQQPFSFALARTGEKLLFTIERAQQSIPLTEDGEYLLMGDEIQRIPPERARFYKPFYNVTGGVSKTQLHFEKGEQEQFVTEVLPHALKLGQVKISQEVEALILKEELEAELYLSREGKGIGAQLKFIYGQREINPFGAESIEPEGEQILLRDASGEQALLGIIEDYNFRVTARGLYLEDDEQIFMFLTDGIDSLKELATIYYSENFKNFFRSRAPLSGGIRLNTDDLLEFSFKLDGVDSGELEEIFAALRVKKRYYRLRDGSFLSLENPELQEVAQIATSLDLSSQDLKREVVKLPKYRAPYLAQKLEDAGLDGFRHNKAFRQLVDRIKNPSDLDLSAPESLEPVLRDYQNFGFQWLKTLSGLKLGGILADDMGLGKTLQVLSLLLAEKEEHGSQPSLVVAPTSLVYNWEAEVHKFAPALKTLVISGSREERVELIGKVPEVDLAITSYPLIRRDIDDYKEIAFRFCILDEAQQIKNASSQGARAVKELKAEARFALTGTPMENSLAELWSLFDFVLPGYLFSYGRFKKKYESPIVREDDKKASEELSRQIRPFILRRVKKDVLRELPDKIEHQLAAELTAEQKKIYLAYLQQIKGELEEEINTRGFAQSQIKILAGLTRLRQICCHPGIFLENYTGDSGKLELLEEIVSEAIAGDHRILLFSQFTSMLQLIRNHLEHERIPYLYLDGSTPTIERGAMVRDFNQGKGDLFLISLKAGGTGLNLTGADTVIHFDPWWNPAVEDQATDRAYRIGQDKVVHVIKLITRGTIEEKIVSLQEQKKALIDTVIQPGQTLLSKLTEQELWEMFAV